MIREDFLFPLLDQKIILGEDSLSDLGSLLPRAAIEGYIAKQLVEIRTDPMWKFGHDNFKNEDESPWEMSPGELAIFRLIALREYPRCQIISSTQYGKSITISRGLLTRVTTWPEEWMLTVPDQKRGKLIIKYMIRDTAQNTYFSRKLFGMQTKDTILLRLLEEKSKVKLTYQILEDDNKPRYGSAEIISADARRKDNAITTIMGFGGRNVISDESSLLDDSVESGIFRMLAGKGEDTFYCKIGNAFFRNHFLHSWKDPRYKKIFIDYVIALCEGRYNEEFIDEAKGKPNFSILFGSAFPKEGQIDSQGWIPLLTEKEVRDAMVEAAHFGEERIGADVADTGENESVIVKRSGGYAEIVFSSDSVNMMQFSGQIVNETWNTRTRRAYIDKVGVGAGVYSRAEEVNRSDKNGQMNIYGVNAGEEPNDKAQFANKRAEMFWRARVWIKNGGRLSLDERWMQLAQVKYKPNSAGKLQMMPKDQMRTHGVESPDVADSLSLTFYDPPITIPMSEDEKFFLKKMHQKNRPQGRSGAKPLSNMPPR